MIRFALAAASVTFLCIATLAGGAAYWWDLLPGTTIDPTADQDRVFAYLVAKDLSQQDKEVRGELIDRLQVELIASPPDSNATAELTSDQIEQLNANLTLLEEEWFWRRVAGYQELPESERGPFLLEQIELVSLWGELAGEAEDTEAESNTADPLEAFIVKMEGWVAKAPAEKQESAWLAVQDAVICWLANKDVMEMELRSRQTLARNIAFNLSLPSMGDDVIGLPLTQAQETQLAENGKRLMEAWMIEKASQYAEVSPPERDAFVDDLIDEISSWGWLGRLFGESGDNVPKNVQQGLSLAQVSQIASETSIWVKRAQSPQKEQLQSLLAAIQKRFFQKQMSGMFGS